MPSEMKQLNVRVPAEVHAALERLVKARGSTKPKVVAALILEADGAGAPDALACALEGAGAVSLETKLWPVPVYVVYSCGECQTELEPRAVPDGDEHVGVLWCPRCQKVVSVGVDISNVRGPSGEGTASGLGGPSGANSVNTAGPTDDEIEQRAVQLYHGQGLPMPVARRLARKELNQEARGHGSSVDS